MGKNLSVNVAFQMGLKEKKMSRKKKVISRPKKKKKKEIGLWDELHAMHNHCQKMLEGVSCLGKTLNHSGLERFQETNEELLYKIELLKQELDLIYHKHKNKSGFISTPDETMEGLLHGESYYQWMTRFEEDILPYSQKLENIL